MGDEDLIAPVAGQSFITPSSLVSLPEELEVLQCWVFFNNCFCFVTSVVMSFTFLRTLQIGEKLLSRQLTIVLQTQPGACLGIPRKFPSSCYLHDEACLSMRPIH